MKKGIFLLLLCMMFSSCIQIESDLQLNNDGSGVMTLSYRVSQVMKELGRIGDEATSLPLPLSKEDFELLLADTEGIAVTSHSVKEIDNETVVNVSFSFTNVKALALFGESDDSYLFQKSKDSTLFRQNLPFAGDEGFTEDSIAMLESYCSGYYFVYTIHTPGPIKEASLGEISKNKKQLVYKISIIDILKAKEKQSIEIKW
ncbi:MAG: hypothetical protein JXJ04_27145 [Spirochaetales bacterium]|nr:hypothetical protein [Spirochaetales bacterium]